MGKHLSAVLMVAALGLLVVPGAGAAPKYDRTCGLLPGDGAFAYVRAANTTCRRAKKVTNMSRKKFCKHHNNCLIDWQSDIYQLYRGRVKRNGWRCKVTVGWEYYRVKCRRGKMRVIARGGA